MAYQALYRKYRPSVFSDVVGQEHITETLKQALLEDKISHAYLFTGTRGTGKTTCAKILAKAVNCLNPQNGDPCGECEICRAVADGEITDIVEIDAASNNNVDSIRELREQIAFPPAAAKYRVYIIDEVHMLSISAFNALLKTLEEPPPYVVFILATTEVHKLPATILSRCQRFDFRRIEPEKICERIKTVSSAEGLQITDDAAMLIASAADGGMRDALSILDLCASAGGCIDEDTVANVCAMAGNEYLLKLSALIKKRDTEGALLLIDELNNSSVDMVRLLGELTEHYRNLMIIKTVKNGKKPIVCSASQLKELESRAEEYDIREIMTILTVLQSAVGKIATANRRCEMEMTVIKLCNPEVFTDITALEKRVSLLESGAVKVNYDNKSELKAPLKEEPSLNSETSEVSKPISENTETNITVAEDEIPLSEPPEDYGEPTPTEIPVPENRKAEPVPDGIFAVSEWEQILSKLRISCPLIAGVLGGSEAYIKGEYLLIDTQNGQFKNLVNGANPLYRNHIKKAALEVLGKTYKLGPYRRDEVAETDPLAAFAKKLESLEK